MADPDDIVAVPRFAATIAAKIIAEHEAEHGELLGVTGRVWSELRKAAESDALIERKYHRPGPRPRCIHCDRIMGYIRIPPSRNCESEKSEFCEMPKDA
jgi:hypothetical protein